MLFIFIRLISFFVPLNVIFPKGTPNSFKIGFAVLTSAIISFSIKVNVDINTTFDLINYAVVETITGLLLGYITSLCFYSLRIAGSLMDQQLGLSMLNIYDPNSKEQTTLLENLMYWMGIMIFFSMNGHHQVIMGIQKSFQLIGVGQSIVSKNFTYIVNVFIQYFVIGFKIAVPVVLALIIADLIMGLISRSVPQLNVMIVGMPLKIVIGMLFVMIILPFIIVEIHNLIDKIPSLLDGTLGIMNNSLATVGPIGVVLSSGSDKTEKPTPKKKRDARKKGNVAKSKEVTTAITLIAMLLIISTLADFIVLQMENSITDFLRMDFKQDFTINTLQVLGIKFLLPFAKVFLPVGFVLIVFGVVGNIIQTGFLFTGEGLKPQLNKINPINGFKNMFSMKALGNLVKSTTIIVVLFIVGISFVKKNFEGILKSGYVYLPYLLTTVIGLIKSLLSSICIVAVIIAIADYIYQRYVYNKELKMTKQEIKEEYKQMEGDPQIKGKIKQRQREMANRRMMQSVPTSTVIVTNPTHLSIAIRYEKGKDNAPIVVAKGADKIALKIREIAKEHDIPIIENKPLARLMYKEVEIDQEIPQEMYQAVAEVLVAVYKIKDKNKYRKTYK